MAERWYSIGSIRFSKPQMWWLVDHLSELKLGRWPQKPDGYIPKIVTPEPEEGEPKKKREGNPMRMRKEPPQNKVLEIAAEVEIRLGMAMEYISGWQRPSRKIRKRREIK